ncbi:hypothetical protein ABZ370_11440 [Streptomyces sp. NPDC005962]|uniref:hypothetical protein n=1 Tax=Streptomyces sp. NPDC005962 TaxID=3154466 RepID=UPI0033E6B4A3
MNTATNRFRGRAGRRLAATILAAAALGLGATACGPDDGADASGSSSSQEASASTQPTGGNSSDDSGKSDNSGSQSQNGEEASAPPAEGGGVANAGNQRTIVGTLKYLAPGKMTVKPEEGGMEQEFLVANATNILGAATICSDDPDGGVSIGDDGYGTAKCSVDELETAAKKNHVTVRVTMDTKSGGANSVEEKYHP